VSQSCLPNTLRVDEQPTKSSDDRWWPYLIDYFNMAGTNMMWHENIWTYMKWQHIVAHLCTPDLDLLLHNRALDEFWNASTRQIRAAYTTRWVSWSRELESLYHLGARPTETRSMQIISIYAILYLYIPLYNIIYTIIYPSKFILTSIIHTINYHYIPIQFRLWNW
jgi:hypothetical protein